MFELKDATVRIELTYTVTGERPNSGLRPIWAKVELLSGEVVGVRIGGPRIRMDGSDGVSMVQNRMYMVQPVWLDEILDHARRSWGMYTSRAADPA